MFSGNEWIIVGLVVLVLFGGSQIPKFARSLGEAQKEFKKGIDEDKKDSDEKKDSDDEEKS